MQQAMKGIGAVALIVALSALAGGCASRGEKLVREWRNYCVEIGGYLPGSEEMDECVWRLYEAEIARRQRIGAALQQAATHLAQPPASSRTPSSVRCTSRTTGNGVETSCTPQ